MPIVAGMSKAMESFQVDAFAFGSDQREDFLGGSEALRIATVSGISDDRITRWYCGHEW